VHNKKLEAFPLYKTSIQQIPLLIEQNYSAPKGRAMKQSILRFLSNESGATAIEYGLIAALIAVVSITTLKSVGTKLNTKFGSVSGALG
jgi:pilus assembly protein Flp/PilA